MILIDMQVDVEAPQEADDARGQVGNAAREIVEEARTDEVLPVHDERKGLECGPQYGDDRHTVIDTVIAVYALSVSTSAKQQKRHHDDGSAVRHKNLL